MEKLAPDQNGADDDLDDNSLRADLEAAIRDAEGAVDAPEAAAPAAPAADPAAGPARGADGKFVSPAAAPPAAAPTTPAAPSAQPQAQQPVAARAPAEGQPPAVDRPPPGWSVQSKADFAALPPHVRADIAKREAEISAGFRQYSEKLKGYEGLDAVIAPWVDRFRTEGVTAAQAIDRLLGAQRMLEEKPQEAIAYLARAYGVDLRQMAGAPAAAPQPVLGADGKPPPQHLQALLQNMIQQAIQPAIQPVLQKVQTFEQSWQSKEQQERAAQEAALHAEIEAFASDPAHPYFDNVLPQVVALIKGGAAKSLDEAYQMAVYANPETRQRLISEQQAAALRTQQAQQQRVVSDAKRAAGSITGAPGNPAMAGDPGAPPDDLRGALEQAWNLHAGRA